ncbi:hypothetical protein RJ639_041919, partial [Escallonia herrerae]
YTISPSSKASSAIPPIVGQAPSYVTHGKQSRSNTPSPAFQSNGSIIHPPGVSSPLKPAPVPQTLTGLAPSLSPNTHTILPPHSSDASPIVSRGNLPSLPPSVPHRERPHKKGPVLVPESPVPVVSPSRKSPEIPPAVLPLVPGAMPPSSHKSKVPTIRAPLSAPIASVPVASPPSNLPRKSQPIRPLPGLSPSNLPGPSVPTSDSPFPAVNRLSPAPSPSPTSQNEHAKEVPFLSPKTGSSPRNTKMPPLPPIQALPPPPPNDDCTSVACVDPLTNTPPGLPCACVWPMQVGLRLSVALYTFFPLVSELATEIANGVFMKQSQVRIMGANAASQDPEKTIVLIDLVPLGEKYDNTTAYLTYQRFWRKQVAIKASFFGDYEVLYVRYPGLPPSPPSAPSSIDEPYSGHDNNGRTIKPLGVDVRRRQHNDRPNGSIIAIIVVSASVAVILCCAVAWVLLFKRRNLVCQPDAMPPMKLPSLAKSSGIAVSTIGSGPSSTSLSFVSSMAAYTGSAKTFSSSDIERATDNFNASRILGEGGFGRVYSGVLEDGTKVAVKVLKRDDQQGGREFLAEVEMLSRLHHRNLVKLIGICTEDRSRCLVYELIPNGSVESHLHGVNKETSLLDWGSRMKIALGAARGLAYLHEDSSPRVIHRDFKSSNILLEDDFMPKVSDFGLARTALDEENRHISTHQCLGPDFPFDSIAKVAAIASMCVQPEVSHRPFMGEVVQALKLVCNECEEAKDLGSRTCSQENLSADFDPRISTNSGRLPDPLLQNRSPLSDYDSALDVERGLSISELFSGSNTYGKLESGSFRRHSSSGSLRTGRGVRLWDRMRRLSGGSVSEHGTRVMLDLAMKQGRIQYLFNRNCFPAESAKPISSPIPVELYPGLAVAMITVGLGVTAAFFIYEATSSRKSRSLGMELTTGAVASVF